MNISNQDLERRLKFATELARHNGKIIADFNALSRKQFYAASSKKEVMSSADRFIGEFNRFAIVSKFPEDSHTDEEAKYRQGTSDFHWYTDPIDGTLAFVEGLDNNAGTLIGLAFKGVPILGVTYQPFVYGGEGELIRSVTGRGAFSIIGAQKPKRISVNSSFVPSIIIGNKNLLDIKTPQILSRLNYRFGTVEVEEISSILKANTVACGKKNVYFSVHPVNSWDIAAVLSHINESNGKITDHYGKNIRNLDEVSEIEGGIVVTNVLTHSDIVETISELFPKKENKNNFK